MEYKKTKMGYMYKPNYHNPLRPWKPDMNDEFYCLVADEYGDDIDERGWKGTVVDKALYATDCIFSSMEDAKFTATQRQVFAKMRGFASFRGEWTLTVTNNRICVDRVPGGYFRFATVEKAMAAIDYVGEDYVWKYYFRLEKPGTGK